MKNLYKIDGGIIDLSEIMSVSEVKTEGMGVEYKFFIGLSAGYITFTFKTSEEAERERSNLIEAIKSVQSKTMIEKATELEKGKFYIFKIEEDATECEIDMLKNDLSSEGIRGIVCSGSIEVIIPKKDL